MPDYSALSKQETLEVDLLSKFRIKQRWGPLFLKPKNSWKVFSGKFELESTNKIIYIRQSEAREKENFAIIGSSNWQDYTLKVRFKILTDSIKPPEGGAILYFLFKDKNNFYSFHFCLFKKRIELIKRFQGIWSIVAGKDYDFETQKDYWVTIITNSGMHQCQIDETDYIKFSDRDIKNGCIGIGAKYCDVAFSHISAALMT